MNKVLLSLSATFIPVWMAGCATLPPGPPPPMPTRLIPAGASESGQSLKAIQGGIVELGSGSYRVFLQATLNDHVVYVRSLFNNQGKQPVNFGPENFTLTDASQVLVNRQMPADITQPYIDQARAARAQAAEAAAEAQAAQNQEADVNAQMAQADEDRRENGQEESKGELVADALQTTGALLTALGAETNAAQSTNEARAAQLALQTFDDRAKTSMLQSQAVPPGAKSQSLVYFTEPSSWPATLRVSMDGHVLAAQFVPGAISPAPPMVADLRVEDMAATNSADFKTLASSLRRSNRVNGIFLEALPLTPALVSARVRAQGFRNAWTPEEVQNQQQQALQALHSNQSEFAIELGAYDPSLIDPSHWQATLIDAHQKEYPMHLTLARPETAATSYVSPYYKMWLIGAADKIDSSQSFQLTLRNSQFITATWDVAWRIQASTATVPH